MTETQHTASPVAPAADTIDIPGGESSPHEVPGDGARTHACTGAQLRRFIKSRPYVPLHELRRRFELGGETDDVSVLDTDRGPAYVGLPPRESGLLQELVRQGEVGLELSLDPPVPVVVGVFPMRPVPRA